MLSDFTEVGFVFLGALGETLEEVSGAVLGEGVCVRLVMIRDEVDQS